MNFRRLAAVILISLMASKAASAIVEYTYTTNGYDLSHWEDWELAWIENEYYYGVLVTDAAQPRKMFSFQAECHPDAQCAFGTGSPAEIRETTINNSMNNDQTLSSVRKITRTHSGFIDPDSMSGGFYADFSARNIPYWEMQGGEYAQVGDYRLTTAGDTYSFSPFFTSTYFFSPEAYYCQYTYGDALEYPNTSPTVCSGGQVAKGLNYAPISLGQGTWTSRQISPVPLPGSLPLLGLGCALLGFAKIRKG